MKKKKHEALRKRIVAKYGRMSNFAEAINLSPQSLSYKLNGKVSWKLEDINSVCSSLDIPQEQIPLFFEI